VGNAKDMDTSIATVERAYGAAFVLRTTLPPNTPALVALLRVLDAPT